MTEQPVDGRNVEWYAKAKRVAWGDDAVAVPHLSVGRADSAPKAESS